MNIIEYIDKGNCSIEELEKLLDMKNPIILYHLMTAIGNYEVYSEIIIKKVYRLTFKRKAEDKLLGYYKIGDLAIITLRKLGENIELIDVYRKLDDFEKKMIVQLAEEIGW